MEHDERIAWFNSFLDDAVNYDEYFFGGNETELLFSESGSDALACKLAVIIPVYNRPEYHRVLSDNMKQAIDYYNRKTDFPIPIEIIFIEHSEEKKHNGIGVKKDWDNYLWIKKGKDDYFNKSLCHNLGAILFRSADYYLFHDVDTLVPVEFFCSLFENLSEHVAVQGFKDRRLQYCNEWVTKQIFANGYDSAEHLEPIKAHLTQGASGAPGGSILVRKDSFFNAGGYCPEFFTGYSVEDQFFWDCLAMSGTIGSSNDPAIELIHLYHEPCYNKTTKDSDWDFFHKFRGALMDEKLHMQQIRADHIKKYINR